MTNDHRLSNRRQVLRSSLAWAGAAVVGAAARARGFVSANERPRMAAVGTGSRWFIKATGLDMPHGSAPDMRRYGDYVAVCDADSQRMGRAAEIAGEWSGAKVEPAADYRAILDRDDIDIVHISTPDHWHAKIAIEAMLSGKDVYCEKPMTLTIDEGKQMCAAQKKTGRVVQVGTQQRSDLDFLKAIALIRDGRLGAIRKATCRIGGAETSPVIPVTAVPEHLDWNQWLGPAPMVEYRYLASNHGETKSYSRTHYEFRWWYEYSGGKLTDWGAHHVDIATWALGKTETGPVSVEPLMVTHPVEFVDGFPSDESRYNTATEFLFRATFDDGVEIEIRHDEENGILFEGTEGSLFVSRGRLSGDAVDALAANPLPEGAIERVYKGRAPTDHYRDFFDAVAARREPISDVHSHHRALTTCHLAGIAGRLGRTVRWDPAAERIVDDPQADGFLSREKRAGFEIEG